MECEKIDRIRYVSYNLGIKDKNHPAPLKKKGREG